MIKIGITGSLASGKSTASKILSNGRGPLFNADKTVRKIYQDKQFKTLISKKFRIKNNNKIKSSITKLIFQNKTNLKKLEKIIHPLVRQKMKVFTSQNKYKKFLFYEIPLLIESKLMSFFDIIIFIKSKKKLRQKRFNYKRNNKKLFNLLDSKQIIDQKKIKFCDHIVVNEKNLIILKKKLLTIMAKYE
jgi:dephospho-CoA kinase